MGPPTGFSLRQHEDPQRRLEAWRQNVGAPVAIDIPAARATSNDAASLLVLSWNVWIGRGRLREVVSRVQNGDYLDQGADPALPIVVLLQEAYRSDESVPVLPSGEAGRILVQTGLHEDVVGTARELGWSLRYAPSMRNGGLPSDRGNAILATLPLEDAHAVELPLVLQRRVAITAGLRLGHHRLRLVTAHLDPRGPPGPQWFGAAGRELQARHLLASVPDETVVLGADLNLGRGRYEPAWRLLAQAGFTFEVPAAIPSWRHTFHALPRLVLDYILVRNGRGVVRQARVRRLDEHPLDRGPRVFGSDHHPLLARIDLQPTPEGLP